MVSDLLGVHAHFKIKPNITEAQPQFQTSRPMCQQPLPPPSSSSALLR